MEFSRQKTILEKYSAVKITFLARKFKNEENKKLIEFLKRKKLEQNNVVIFPQRYFFQNSISP